MEQKETIIYKGKKYHRYPDSKRRQHRVYYYRHDKWNEPPFPLHRQIWIDHNGEIPKGHIIHHKDNNPLNNEIGNLEALSASQHSKLHSNDPTIKAKQRLVGIAQSDRLVKDLARWKRENPEVAKAIAQANGKRQAKRATESLKKWKEENKDKFREICRQNGLQQKERAIQALHNWRTKPEAKEFLKKNVIGTIQHAIPIKANCVICDSPFTYVTVRPAKYCSDKCRNGTAAKKLRIQLRNSRMQ